MKKIILTQTSKEDKKEQKFNSDVERDKLIEQYLPYATSIASKMARTMPSEVDFDDIICTPDWAS